MGHYDDLETEQEYLANQEYFDELEERIERRTLARLAHEDSLRQVEHHIWQEYLTSMRAAIQEHGICNVIGGLYDELGGMLQDLEMEDGKEQYIKDLSLVVKVMRNVHALSDLCYGASYTYSGSRICREEALDAFKDNVRNLDA